MLPLFLLIIAIIVFTLIDIITSIRATVIVLSLLQASGLGHSGVLSFGVASMCKGECLLPHF